MTYYVADADCDTPEIADHVRSLLAMNEEAERLSKQQAERAQHIDALRRQLQPKIITPDLEREIAQAVQKIKTAKASSHHGDYIRGKSALAVSWHERGFLHVAINGPYAISRGGQLWHITPEERIALRKIIQKYAKITEEWGGQSNDGEAVWISYEVRVK